MICVESTQMPVQGDPATASAGDRVTMHCGLPNEPLSHSYTDKILKPYLQTNSTTTTKTTPRPSQSTTRPSRHSQPVTTKPRAGAAPSNAPKTTAALLALTVSQPTSSLSEARG